MGSILFRFVIAAAVLLGAGAAIGSRLGSTARENAPALVDPHLVTPPSARTGAPPSPAEPAPPATHAAGRAIASPGDKPSAAVTVPQAGTGAFTAAAALGPVRGAGGRLHRYRVTVEGGTGQDPMEVAAIVDAVLGDPRSWIAGGTLRVQLVPGDAPADFTVLLATPATSEAICATGGLRTERYSSCRLPGRVVLNLARWLTAVPNYGASLDEYRRYLVNHEVGHQFGHGHEACPGRGQPAPVMQQQTYGLDGCVANAWPYIGGKRYSGRAVK
jgi:hypothetical protein